MNAVGMTNNAIEVGNNNIVSIRRHLWLATQLLRNDASPATPGGRCSLLQKLTQENVLTNYYLTSERIK